MRNLKRLLTMVMAIAMMMSLMVVGAGATSFKDDKDITNKDAVEKMASLNIINGRDDGNFDPAGIVTRAEMAKMICVALNGGNDPKLSSSSVVTSSFVDTKGHWAEGYIEYCVNMGIAAGLGNNTFGPDQKVTASQAAKMLLVALGYDATYEKFTGPTWALNSNKVAQQKGLYDEIQGIDPNAPMSRDAAAQMIDNFTSAPMVKYEFGISGGSAGTVTGVKQATDIQLVGGEFQTVLNKFYKLVEKQGYLNTISYDSKKKEYTYGVFVADTNSTTGSNLIGNFVSTTDYSKLFGAKVEVLYRDKNNNGTYQSTSDSVYDINLYESAILASGVMDDFGSLNTGKLTVKFDSVTYDLDDKNVETMVAYSGNAGSDIAVTSATDDTAMVPSVATPYNVILIDNDKDGKLDKVVYQPFTVNKVTYAGTSSSTFSVEGSVQSKDFIGYDGMKKDDIVAYYDKVNALVDSDSVKKLDTKTGSVSGVKDGNNKLQIEGKWYTNNSGTSVGINDKIDYVAVGTILYYAKVVDYGATSKEILTVYQTATDNNGFETVYKAKIMFADGTKKTITLDKVNGSDTRPLVVTVGQMYSYKVNSDGEYELMVINGTNKAGHDLGGSGSNYVASSEKLAGKTMADDAKIFVVDTTKNEIEKYSGKEIKNYDINLTGSVTYLANEDNGLERIKIATLYGPSALPEITTGSNYGYLTEDAYVTYEKDENYRNFTIWTGKGETPVVLKEKDTDSVAAFKKGAFITYDNDSDSLIKNVTLLDTTKAPIAAVTGYKDKTVAINGDDLKIDDDTVIIYVDHDDNKAAQGDIQQAVKYSDGSYLDNVRYVKSGDTLKALLVDVNNSMLPNAGAMSTANFNADPTVAFNKFDNIIINENFTNVGDLEIPAGKTLIVSGNLTTSNTAGEDITVKGNLQVKGDLTTIATKGLVDVTSTGKLTVVGNAVLAAADVLAGQVTVNGTLAVNANASVAATGTLTVNGKTTVAAANTLTVVGAAILNEVDATGSINVNGTAAALTINDATAIANGKTITLTDGVATLNGAVTGAGKVVVATDKTLTVKNDVAILNNSGIVNIDAAAIIGAFDANVGTINVKANATFSNLSIVPTAVNVAAGKTLTVTSETVANAVEKITGAAGTQLIMSAESNANYAGNGSAKFYLVTGTEIATTAKVHVSTYDWKVPAGNLAEGWVAKTVAP